MFLLSKCCKCTKKTPFLPLSVCVWYTDRLPTATLSTEKIMQDIAVAGGLSLNLAARGGVSSFLPLQRELSQCVMGLEGVFWVKGHNCCLWLYLWMECQSGSSHSGRWSCPPSRLIVGIIQHERGKANVPGLRMSYSLTLEL